MQIIRITGETTKLYAMKIIDGLPRDGSIEVCIRKYDPNRTAAHNAVQWPILNAFADQLLWPVNGQMVKLTGEEWKDILTAAYRQEVPRVAMGLNGGVVMLGYRTRDFKRSEWGEWMEFLQSVAAERGVKIPVSKREAAAYE